MKRFMVFVVLLLGFLFSSHTPYDPGVSSTTVDKDSTTLEVKFQNPRVIVEDNRTVNTITEYLKNKNSIGEDVITFLQSVDQTVKKDQERRYESALDYLSRRSSISKEDIILNLNTYIKKRNIISIVFATLFILLVLRWQYVNLHKLMDGIEKIASFGILLVYSVALYILYLSILRIITPYEYMFIKELLKLTG